MDTKEIAEEITLSEHTDIAIDDNVIQLALDFLSQQKELEEQQKQIALKDEAIENIKEYNSLIPLHKNCDPHIIGYAKRIEAWCEKAFTQDTSDYILVKKEPSKEKISALVEWDRTHEYFDANDYMRDLYKSMIVSKE